MSLLEIILLCVLCLMAAFAAVRFLFRKDTEIEERRRGAARLAGKLSSLGLKRTPAFLIDYSVGDYSGMANKIAELARLFLDSEDAVMSEFDAVFSSVLDAKLQTEPGRAYIAAKLTDAAKPSDVSAVANAPVAGVV